MRIALIGAPGSGKSSIAKAWCDLTGATRLSFAGAVKDEVARALAAADYDADEWQWIRDDMDDPEKKDRYRRILQLWGTDFRRAEDPEYWVRQIVARVGGVPQWAKFAIDDCRFPNEYAALRGAGFVFVKLLSGETTREQEAAAAQHESERYWPLFACDLELPYERGPKGQALALDNMLRASRYV